MSESPATLNGQPTLDNIGATTVSSCSAWYPTDERWIFHPYSAVATLTEAQIPRTLGEKPC